MELAIGWLNDITYMPELIPTPIFVESLGY